MNNINTGPVNIAEKVREIVEPIITGSGIELVDVEYFRGPGGMVLRLIVDKPGGVTLDDCADVSHLAGDVLDVEDPVPGSYNLEVSSPGINRPLKRLEDFDRFKGEKAFIQVREMIEGRRRFKGILAGMDNGTILLEIEGELKRIPFDQILKARLDII